LQAHLLAFNVLASFPELLPRRGIVALKPQTTRTSRTTDTNSRLPLFRVFREFGGSTRGVAALRESALRMA